jgi:Na+-driven multidrug efflux pump
VAVIGMYLGTRELSAYLVVGILLSLTASFSSGLQDSLATLCTAAIDVENKKLAGQYVQLSIVFSILFSGVNIAVWMLFAGDVLEWFGFDQETVSIGEDFATLLVLRDLIRGVAWSVHSFLYVIGLDVYSTVMTTLEEVVTTVAVVLAILLWGSTLETVGIIYIISAYSILILNLVVIKGEGWFHEFRDGLVRPSALLVSNL